MCNPVTLPAIDFSQIERAVIGVSGGSDSTALLVLLRDRIAESDTGTALLAVTVDHGLRRESAGEAARVSDFCASIGVAHTTLKWQRQTALKSGVAAAARSARYRLLARAADEFGAGVIFTGHTLDDQIETVAMRAARGPGRGLAGIAPLTLWGGAVWIVRPLLDFRREELRDFLKERGTGWIEDPSNVDKRNERVRVRIMLAGREENFERQLLEKRDEAEEQRIADNRQAARLIDQHVRQAAPGLFEINAAAIANGGQGAVTALRALIAVSGGNEQLPDRARILALKERLAAETWRGSLGGCVIERLGKKIYIWREFRGDGPAAVAASGGTVWDGRWALTAGMGGSGKLITALGRNGKLPPCADKDLPPRRLRRASAATLPVLVTKGGEDKADAPEFDPKCFSPVLAPWRCFLPVFDFELAVSTKRLANGPGLPDIPAALKKLLPT